MSVDEKTGFNLFLVGSIFHAMAPQSIIEIQLPNILPKGRRSSRQKGTDFLIAMDCLTSRIYL